MAWKNNGNIRGVVAAWREKFEPHATTQRRNEKLKKGIND